MAKHKGQETEEIIGGITETKHTHDIHESSDADNIYRSCRTCPFSETIPRK